MLSQKEFVEGCYNWYREADLQPGNPEDGDWDEAHYPVPKCKGGTETILLLKEHHAIQGVIQSEEVQWKCIFNWERKYLSGEYLELFNKWLSEGAKLQHASETEEKKILRAEKMRAYHAQLTEEEKILFAEKCRDGHARRTEEEKILWAEKCRANTTAQHAQMTEEKKLLKAEKCRAKTVAHYTQMTEEERILRVEKVRAGHARMTEEKKILRAEKMRASAVVNREKRRAKAIAQRAREKFNKEVEDLVAVWEMGLRP